MAKLTFDIFQRMAPNLVGEVNSDIATIEKAEKRPVDKDEILKEYARLAISQKPELDTPAVAFIRSLMQQAKPKGGGISEVTVKGQKGEDLKIEFELPAGVGAPAKPSAPEGLEYSVPAQDVDLAQRRVEDIPLDAPHPDLSESGNIDYAQAGFGAAAVKQAMRAGKAVVSNPVKTALGGTAIAGATYAATKEAETPAQSTVDNSINEDIALAQAQAEADAAKQGQEDKEDTPAPPRPSPEEPLLKEFDNQLSLLKGRISKSEAGLAGVRKAGAEKVVPVAADTTIEKALGEYQEYLKRSRDDLTSKYELAMEKVSSAEDDEQRELAEIAKKEMIMVLGQAISQLAVGVIGYQKGLNLEGQKFVFPDWSQEKAQLQKRIERAQDRADSLLKQVGATGEEMQRFGITQAQARRSAEEAAYRENQLKTETSQREFESKLKSGEQELKQMQDQQMQLLMGKAQVQSRTLDRLAANVKKEDGVGARLAKSQRDQLFREVTALDKGFASVAADMKQIPVAKKKQKAVLLNNAVTKLQNSADKFLEDDADLTKRIRELQTRIVDEDYDYEEEDLVELTQLNAEASVAKAQWQVARQTALQEDFRGVQVEGDGQAAKPQRRKVTSVDDVGI
jgi:hypothetical protein